MEQLFYSRTVTRGLILAGHSLSQRVPGHDWPPLIGAPHRLARHPITPKAVFRIQWKAIERRDPAVACLKPSGAGADLLGAGHAAALCNRQSRPPF